MTDAEARAAAIVQAVIDRIETKRSAPHQEPLRVPVSEHELRLLVLMFRQPYPEPGQAISLYDAELVVIE